MKKIILTAVILLVVTSANSQDQKKAGTEQEIKKLSADWMKAAMARDEKTLDKIVAPEFTLGGTDVNRPGISREIWMKNTMENIKIDSVNYIHMGIKVIDNVAVVQSRFYWSFSFQNMPAKTDTVNLVDTWIKRGQNWQVINRIVID